MSKLNLITDLAEIKKLSAKKWDENCEFRIFLKGLSLTAKQIDAIVHRIYKQVNAQIDCTQCANCCRVTNTRLSANDISNAATGLKISPDEFIDQYLVSDEKEHALEFKSLPCPLLSGKLCSIYEHRPADCRSFPHLHKKNFTTRTIGIIHNCEICPIIFNVWELLKQEFEDFYENDEDDFDLDLDLDEDEDEL